MTTTDAPLEYEQISGETVNANPHVSTKPQQHVAILIVVVYCVMTQLMISIYYFIDQKVCNRHKLEERSGCSPTHV